MIRLWAAAIVTAGALATTAAVAAPGDTYRVTGERVNLRAGPSDSANVRGQVLGGEQLVELRRDGNWYGVRVLRTGEEGWVFGNLIEPLATSTLSGGEGGVASAGFGDLSRDFDRLLGSLTQRYGFPLFDRVSPAGGDTLEVKMTEHWLRAGSQDEHLLAAAAIYQMWKNHQNSAPVRVVLLDPRGERYVTIDETQGPALLTVAAD
jgi:uncharacterized protein YgiM (DUF1202 family)